MLGLKLNHVSKRGLRCETFDELTHWCAEGFEETWIYTLDILSLLNTKMAPVIEILTREDNDLFFYIDIGTVFS